MASFSQTQFLHTLCRLRGSNICKFVERTFVTFEMHFIVFSDMKSKHFSNASRYSSLYIISSIRQPAAQKLDKIHVLYARKFCTRLRLNLCWCTSETFKYKNATIMATTLTTMTTAILAAKGIHKTSRFSQALLHEGFTSKRWLSFKTETWNFIKCKLLTFFNSTKMDYVFAGLNLNILFKKAREKCNFRGRCFENKGH